MVLANLTFLACEQESEETFPDNRAVVFAPLHSVWGGGAQSRAHDTETGTEWDQGDEVGIYMIAADAENLTGAKASNVLYTIDATDTLVPDDDPIKYLDNNLVNFVAYYPWKGSNEIPDGLYPVDVSTQEPLMIHNGVGTAYGLNEGKVVSLLFKHKLSKLVITAEPVNGTTIDMSGATLTISGMPTKANCNLYTGLFSDWDEIKDIGNFHKSTDTAEKAVWKALIIPHKAVNYTGCTFTIEAGGEIYKYPLTAADDFDPGNVYTYTFTLTTE
jgi:endonuclease G